MSRFTDTLVRLSSKFAPVQAKLVMTLMEFAIFTKQLLERDNSRGISSTSGGKADGSNRGDSSDNSDRGKEGVAIEHMKGIQT
mmetsp:Transcript_2723/g.5138  ORF Transcript_2723/g.5138 Transcript_2723/m.5138 type:complete len:83 (-) Transcript_2723:173-421(-)